MREDTRDVQRAMPDGTTFDRDEHDALPFVRHLTRPGSAVGMSRVGLAFPTGFEKGFNVKFLGIAA